MVVFTTYGSLPVVAAAAAQKIGVDCSTWRSVTRAYCTTGVTLFGEDESDFVRP